MTEDWHSIFFFVCLFLRIDETLDAVKDILGRAVVEVRKNAFDFDNSDGRTLNWTPIQFWAVMKQLAASETVRLTLSFFHDYPPQLSRFRILRKS